MTATTVEPGRFVLLVIGGLPRLKAVNCDLSGYQSINFFHQTSNLGEVVKVV